MKAIYRPASSDLGNKEEEKIVSMLTKENVCTITNAQEVMEKINKTGLNSTTKENL